ncbi:MAG TPA: hypothetical protein VK858_09465 [Longimicrobiales bacterium]|nr:hypothetical protein [Longimicrobiales bacterium]
MSFVPRRPVEPDSGRAHATLVDEHVEISREQRADASAARWRAGALAEAIFGGRVVPRLRSARTMAGFRALLELEVPFRDLGRHREAETRFLQAARRDELLGRLPVVFVFTPVAPEPIDAPVPATGGA